MTVAAQLSRAHVIPLTDSLALSAADIALDHGLAMADAIVYATARACEAQLITSDADFATLPGVSYIPAS